MSEPFKRTSDSDLKRVFSSLIYPFVFISIMWLVFWGERLFELHLYQYGIFPRKIEGLQGILFGPLIHGDINHLFDNSIPLLVLGWALFYFYRKIAFQVIIWTYLMSGILVWLSARDSFHIGASALIYGFVAFLFLSGFLRKHIRLMGFSLLVVFLYGSLWWGVLPVKPGISWEGHLWGGVAGLILALYFRNEGPQRPYYQWELDEMYENEAEEEEEKPSNVKIRYHFKERNEDGK